MARFAFVFAVAMAVLVSGLPASALPVVLRGDLEVAGPSIRLGDLFTDADVAAETVLAPAPAPGRATTFESAWVAERARAAGLLWDPSSAGPRVVVRRASQSAGRDELAQLIRDRLEAEDGGVWRVTLAPNTALHAAVDEPFAPEVTAIERAPGGDRVTALIAPAPGAAPTPIYARAEASIETPALTRALARGEVVTEADVVWIETPTARAPAGMIADASELIGRAAQRPLRAGVPLRAGDVAEPAAVRKNDPVLLVYQVGGLRLTARGRALADAPLGGSARVLNLQSNRTIEAVVTGPGEARVAAVSGRLGA